MHIYIICFILFICTFKAILSIFLPILLLNLLLIALLVYGILLKYNKFYININLIKIYYLLIIILIGSLYSLELNLFNVKMMLFGFCQIFIPILYINYLDNINKNDFYKIIIFIKFIGMLLIFYALLEILLIPNNLRLAATDYFNFSKNGVANAEDIYSYEIPFVGLYNRPGSLLFDTLAFANIAVISFATLFQNKNHKKYLILKILYSIVILLSLVKSAILTMIFIIIFISFKNEYTLKKFCFLIFTFIILILIQNYEFLILGNRFSGFESISNHILGLVFGLSNSFENPIFGHGFGTAGYQVYLEALKFGISGPFNGGGDWPELENGNESAIGILYYQMGLFVTTYLVYKYYFINNKILFSNKNRAIAGLMFGFFFLALLTESFLSFSIIFNFIPVILYYYKFQNTNE